MPTTIINISFSDQFNAGTTPNFVGNLSDTITAIIELEYTNMYDASPDPSIKLAAFDSTTLFPSGSRSGKQAFSLAEFNITFEQRQEWQTMPLGTEVTASGFTGAINGTYTFLYWDNATSSVIMNEAHAGNNAGNNGMIYVSEAVEAASMIFALYEGYQGGTPLSANLPYTLETPNGTTIDHTNTTPVNMVFKNDGTYQNNGATIEGANLGITGVQGFIICHTFDLSPISKAVDELFMNPLQTGYSYGYSVDFKSDFFSSLSVIDQLSQINQGDPRIGTIGAFDSNFGSTTNYSFSNFSIVKTANGEVSNVPIVQQKFTVSFDIDNTTDSPFSDLNTQVKIGIERRPTAIFAPEPYEGYYLYDRAITTLGAGAISGEATGDAASITNYTAVFNSADSVTVSFDVEYSANAIALINSDVAEFAIFASVQDHTKTYSNSDRVTLKVFQGQGVQKILDSPIVLEQSRFLKSPFSDLSKAVDASQIDGFPVELLVGISTFNADWTNRPNLRINKVEQKLVLKNSVTSEEIELDSTIIPVDTFPLFNNEYPAANYEVQKGFKIPVNEVRNLVHMSNYYDAVNVHAFEVRFPFFIRWEDYRALILQNIPSDLIDHTEPNNGINYDLHRLDTVANWDVAYRLTFTSEEDGIVFTQSFDETLTTTDYDSHSQVVSRSVRSFTEDGVTELVNGLEKFVESTENTLIVGSWDLTSAPTSADDFEIEFYIEVKNGGGPTQIHRISSVNGLLTSSWFKDTGAGDGLVVKSIDGNKAVGKALINVSNISLFDDYRVYGAFYNPPKEGSLLITENDIHIVTESGYNLILE